MLSRTLSTRIKSTAAALALVSLSSRAMATIDTTDVLPKNVNTTQLRYGVMDGADKKFDSSGSLITQLDANSMQFGTTQIKALDVDAARLIDVLNQTGHANYGNALNLGTLNIDARPDIRYFAPIYARGITPRLTIGVALPVINYNNTITLSEHGSNVADIHKEIGQGTYGPDVESAFVKMEAGVIPGLNQTLRERGYKPLTSRHESLIGDAQVVSVYKLYELKKASVNNVATLTLPTGKPDDPDDLTDLGTYGELALEEGLLANYFVSPSVGFAFKGSYKFVAPQHADVRVKANADDALPSQDRKETVWRDGGDVATLSSSAILNVGERLQFGSGLDLSYKQKDKISGSHADWDYSLLEANTEQTNAKIRIGVEYFTTTAYTHGHSKIPFKVAYEFANVFAGKNALNTTIHELGLSLFF